MKPAKETVYPITKKRRLYQTFMGEVGFTDEPKKAQVANISQTVTTFDLFRTKVATEAEEAYETLRCLWPFFRFSRLIGMCPITRQGVDLVVQKYHHWSWIATWIALAVQFIMVGNAINQTRKAVTTKDLIKLLNSVIYYTHTLANTIFMSLRIGQIPQFLLQCKKIETVCKKHRDECQSDRLARDCFLLMFFFELSQCVGNAIYLASIASKAKAQTITEFFRSFDSDFIGEWGGIYTGIFFCFGELYCDIGWGFADIFLALISVVFARYFQRLNAVLRKKRGLALSLPRIEELRCEHREICHLVQLCNNIFSPLFLLTYVANIGYLFTRLYTGLSDDLEDPTFMVRFESIYAFCYQLLVKILAPSYLAARLHEQAHEGLKLIHNWPSAIDAPDSKCRLLVMGRFVSQLVTTPIGISGCGYFLISKSFMVTLISALVTYEVIILQFQGASLKTEE